MAKSIITTVGFSVTIEVEHPENYNAQSIRLAALSALRNALFNIDNSKHGFYLHPFADNENVTLSLGTVEFN